MANEAIKQAIKSVLNVEFLAKLVSVRNNLGTITTPISDAQSLIAQVESALATSSGMDAAMLKACQNEVIGELYKIVVAMKLLVPSSWNTLNVSDWMYSYSYQIWSRDAVKSYFGPKRHPQETTEQYVARRKLGAKNSLVKLERHTSLVDSLLEVFTQMQTLDQITNTVILAGLFANQTSLVAADGYLVNRIAVLSRGEVGRLTKIQKVLYQLQQMLARIANE